ncbi:15-cis-zeta-carotene isomerase, chloroplastic-like [Gastrolobium bilobum]|uniref:15-cis-zeta-carotene isomerase, chloroplastic-like n=1 Tax=Gastrolobium bilobum TaxID=150636 RepID=UPI002AAFADDB|nr:15-cis-zeta-carotene isomerase, chloroplastic-like [Gastrolobium bilobum]
MASLLVLSSSISSVPQHSSSQRTRYHDHRRPLYLPSSSFSKRKQSCPCFSLFPSKPLLLFSPKLFARASSAGDADTRDSSLVGEDSAAFDLQHQKISSWVYFTAILGVVLFGLNVAWIDASTGFGKAFVDAVSGISDSHEVVVLVLILIFASVHSGLASFRDTGEKLIGERAYRVLFAGISLPLVVTTIVYFINHRYDGLQLWQLQNVSGVHEFVWLSNFISFLFLYPSTFNLLEVAAVDKPKLHLWETGIIRITRHPQMVGQVMWCLAHTVWIGNSVTVAASIGLIAHHLFGVWNGDRRLAIRYGKDFEIVKGRTSIIPFAAIIDGRQRLPKDFYKEFIRLPYFTIITITLGAYFAHPLMQAASFKLHW